MASFGQPLVGMQPPINPFAQQGPPQMQAPPPPPPIQELPLPTPQGPPDPAQGPPQPPPPAQTAERKVGWKAFIERFKTDPNLRLALMQTAIGLTQPAGSPAEGVGKALGIGVQTLDALKTREYERGRQGAADTREERKVGVSERGAAVGERGAAVQEAGMAEEQARGSRQQTQFDQTLQQQRDELDARLEEIKSSDNYRREQIKVEREKIAAGGESGQVNQRWNTLSNLLLKVRPELVGGDPDTAKAYAWDLMQNNQGRGALKAKLIADQMLFLPDPQKDPAKYQEAFNQLSQRTDTILDAAGVTDERIFSAPGAGTPQPTAQPGGPQAQARPAPQQLSAGQTITIDGQPIQIIGMDDKVMRVQTPEGVKTWSRQMVEQELGITRGQ